MCYYPKGKPNRVDGVKHHANKSTQNKNTAFYPGRGTFYKGDEYNVMDVWAKPGLRGKNRVQEPYNYTYPSTKFRSQYP